MRHILVVTYWPFSEGLIQAYTIPYLRIIREVSGAKVTLLTLEKSTSPPQIVGDGIEHLPVHAEFFNMRMAFRWRDIIRKLVRFCREQNVTHLHSWCTPGGAMAWLIARKTQLPLIADSFEPHADAMVENGTWTSSSLKFRILFYLEKKLAHSARYLISVSPYMKEYAERRYGLQGRKMFIKPACTDLDKFQPINNETTATITGIYAGKLGGIYYEDEVFTFLKACHEKWGDQFRFIFLGNYTADYIHTKCAAVNLPPELLTVKFVHHNEVPSIMASATFGFTPVKPVPTKKCCTPVKDGEYWACGLPVVITPDISVDSELIESGKCGIILRGTDMTACRAAVDDLSDLLQQDRTALKHRCRTLAVRHRNFIIAREIYTQIYNGEE